MSDSSARPTVPLFMAFIGASTAAVALYAVLRIIQWYLFPEPNPATVVWSAHAGYLWRIWIVCYAGVMAGFGSFAAARVAPERTGRALVHALTFAALLIAFQGVFVP